MEFKNGVSVSGIKPEIVLALAACDAIFIKRFAKMVITSCVDGKHSKNSYHYDGYAVDLRSRGTGLAQQIRDDCALLLGHMGYDVVLEDKDGPNEHIHVEFDLKKQASYKEPEEELAIVTPDVV